MTVIATQKIVSEVCPRCGVVFGVTERFQEERYKDKKSFYCPNGHSQYYPQETEEDRLRLKLHESYEEQQRLIHEVEETEEQRRQAQRSAAAYKGHYAKQKKRVSRGVCPCCNRYFKQLHRHIRNQHPEYLEE